MRSPPASSLPCESAGSPFQNSALPFATVTTASVAAGKHMSQTVFCWNVKCRELSEAGEYCSPPFFILDPNSLLCMEPDRRSWLLSALTKVVSLKRIENYSSCKTDTLDRKNWAVNTTLDIHWSLGKFYFWNDFPEWTRNSYLCKLPFCTSVRILCQGRGSEIYWKAKKCIVIG